MDFKQFYSLIPLLPKSKRPGDLKTQEINQLTAREVYDFIKNHTLEEVGKELYPELLNETQI